MAKPNIGFDNWPFATGERAKLIKLSKPYSENGKWYVKAVYLSTVNNKAKQIKHLFGDVHLLVTGAEYVDGERQHILDWGIIDIWLPENVISNKKIEARLIVDKNDSNFNYYTFGFSYNNEYYIVPLVEIVRVLLAPDVFWLNQLTSLDSIDTRIVCEHADDILTLDCSTDVPVRYVKMDSKIKHAAWLFSNSVIHKIVNQIYQNIKNGDGILFDFSFKEFEITAKFEKWNGRNYIREIIACKGKKILCSDVIVRHPGMVEFKGDDKNSEDADQCTRRKSLGDANGVKTLVSNLAATPNVIDIEQDDSMYFEYSSIVKIERVKTLRSGSASKGLKMQEGNGAGSNIRTTADTGGLETAPQLEFEHVVNEKQYGVFADIVDILKLMGERVEVRTIGYHIGELNDHFKSRSVCTLDDGIMPRKYLAGNIKLIDGKEAMLIEVEKTDLTTLMVISAVIQDWNLVCHKIMKGFIEKSGSWPDFEGFEFKEVGVCKFRHSNVDVGQREKRMFENLKASSS